MTLESAIVTGRAAAERRMTSRATVRRLTGTTTGSNGFQVDSYADVVTNSPFRLGGSERGTSGTHTVRVGQVEVEVATRIGHFPASTTGLKDGDLIEVTAGENAGSVFRIVEASWQDQATARRVPVVEVQRPEAWA